MAHQNGRIPDPRRDAAAPYASRGDDRDRESRSARDRDDRDREDRDRELRGAMRDYPDHVGSRETSRDAWRPEDHNDRDDRRFDRRFDRPDQRFDPRFDDRGDDRFGDRSWSGAGERFSESDRSTSERPYRAYARDERYGMRGDLGYHASDLDRMQEQDDRDRGWRGDRDDRDRDHRNAGRPFTSRPFRDDGDRMYGARDDTRRGEWGVQVAGQNRVQVAGQGNEPAAREPGGHAPQRGPHHGKGPVGFQRSDERIREVVCEALTDHGDIDASHIEVSVKACEVTLSGTVDDRRTKRLAEDCVAALPGVKDVHNQLRVGEPKAGFSEHRASTEKHGTDKAEHADKKHRPS